MRFLRWLPFYTFALAFAFSGSTQPVRAQRAPRRRSGSAAFVAYFHSFGDDNHPRQVHSGGINFAELSWINTPAGTVPFLLHMHDLDVSRNKTTEDQLHWLVWNIPGNVIDSFPRSAHGANQDGHPVSASGPGCIVDPAPRLLGPRHHYTFELYALDTEARHSARHGRLCHSRGSYEGHSGPHTRQGRLYRPFPQTEITSVRRWFRLKMDAAQQFWRGVSFSELFQNGGGENGSAFSGSSKKIA